MSVSQSTTSDDLDVFLGRLPEGYEEPWKQFRNPTQTLADLATMTVAKSDLKQDSDRVLARVLADPMPLLEDSFEEQQEFLRRLERSHKQDERAENYPFVRYVGLAVLAIAIGLGAFGLLAGLFILTGTFDWALGWRVAVSIAIAGGLGLLWYLGFDFFLDDWAMYVGAGGAVAVSVLGSVLISRQLVPGGLGVLLGIAAAGAVAAFGLGGRAIWVAYRPATGFGNQQAYDRWRAKLLRQAVTPAVNAALNYVAEDDYSLSLVLSGSMRTDDVGAVVETRAAADLREVMAWRRKGSFALAGPRGSGKSTLLHRWASGVYASRGARETAARRDLIVEVSAPVGYDQREFLVYLFGRLCESVERYARRYSEADLATGAGGLLGNKRGRRALPYEFRRTARRDVADLGELVQCARAERDAIRFVQSTTSVREFSAGLGHAGMSVGGKAGESVRRDDIPLNYPELVDEFRWFLEQAARVVTFHGGETRRGRPGRHPSAGGNTTTAAASVFIAIDELDRISDGELAQKFINELKAVFGVPNCFFLVSVSEDALAEFELAAMGMRTVFDSAFDEIVRVDYLGLSEARELLDRLFVGLPLPFTALAYVLSGGLARQLVRIAYQIAEMGRSPDTAVSLDDVSASLVQRQFRKTVRAAIDRLFGSVTTGFGADLFRILDDVPSVTPNGPTLHHLRLRLQSLGPEPDDQPLLGSLRNEVAAMCNYLATVLGIFATSEKDRLEQLLVSGTVHFDTLARARRYLGANPQGADELLETFRSSVFLHRAVGPDGR